MLISVVHLFAVRLLTSSLFVVLTFAASASFTYTSQLSMTPLLESAKGVPVVIFPYVEIVLQVEISVDILRA